MPDPSMEGQAVVSLIARSYGLDVWPTPDGGQVPLIEEGAAAQLVADGDSLSNPAKLELLAHLSRRRMPEPVLVTIAASLVKPGLIVTTTDVVGALLARVAASRAGEDALGRTGSEPLSADDVLVGSLVPEIGRTRVLVSPTCDATLKDVNGYLALSIRSTIESPEPLDALRPLADPREWPRCPVQAEFFKSMEPVRELVPLRRPQVGWEGTLREIVDFSFGLGDSSAYMDTDLDFRYSEKPGAITCTYNLANSRDRKILVDRGHVIIHDRAGPGVHIETLKQVAFATRPHPGDVCQPWSRAQAIAASSCLSKTHPVQEQIS